MIGNYGWTGTYGETAYEREMRLLDEEMAWMYKTPSAPAPTPTSSGSGIMSLFRLPSTSSEITQQMEAGGVAVKDGRRRGGRRRGTSAEDLAAVTTGVGTLTSGIADLIGQIRGNRQPTYAPVDQRQLPAAPAQSAFPTGPVLLGVGALVMMGLLAAAAMSAGGKRRRGL